MDKELNGMCDKCRRRKTCKVPCAFVEQILRHENRGVFEKPVGDDQIKVFMRHPEVRESALRTIAKGKGQGETASQEAVDAVFSTNADNPFNVNNFKLDRTQVFIRRFIMGQTYQHIAEVFDTDAEKIRGIYGNAVNRLVYALELLDKRLPVIDNARYYFERSKKVTGQLPKNQKHFLLAKLFGLTPKEIHNLDGTGQATISQNIQYVADRLRTGQLVFLDPTDDEMEQARGRLDKMKACNRTSRAKRRQRDRAA